MTSESDPISSGSRLRDEAAIWFAVMRGPDATAKRVEFDDWLARDPLRRAAYNRIAETFSIGKGLKTPPARSPLLEPDVRRWKWSVSLLAGLTVTALVAGWVLARPPFTQIRSASVAQSASIRFAHSSLPLTTRLGEVRTFRLADGSSVVLDTDSRLVVAFTSRERRLRLERGRARFEVAHEARDFVVGAGGGSVTARGTIFDVALADRGSVHVRLVRGIIDVAAPPGLRSGPATGRRVRLTAGQGIAFGRAGSIERAPAAGIDGNWTDTIRSFDQIRLADLVAEANRYSSARIVLASPTLDAMRVSGTFRLRDARALPGKLAGILDLSITQKDGLIVLSPACGAGSSRNCAPAS